MRCVERCREEDQICACLSPHAVPWYNTAAIITLNPFEEPTKTDASHPY